MNSHACCLIMLMAMTCSLIGGSLAIRIDLIPETYNQFDNDVITMSCTIDDMVKVTTDVILIEILKDGQKPIAVQRSGQEIKFTEENPRHEAQGHIAPDIRHSYLNLTITNPQPRDYGVYSCVMYFMDENNMFRQARASRALKEEKMSVELLGRVVSELKDEIKELKEKATFTTAFAVTNKISAVPVSPGEVLVLPDVIMMQGQGYNVTTGVFTAPRDGLYVFHVTTNVSPDCRFDIDLKANDNILASAYLYDQHHYEQTSISFVTKLSSGDNVFSVMRGPDTTCTLNIGYSTYFTGYLIQSF